MTTFCVAHHHHRKTSDTTAASDTHWYQHDSPGNTKTANWLRQSWSAPPAQLSNI